MATPELIAEQKALQGINADYTEKYGFHDPENYLFKAPKGLTRELVAQISAFKNEPEWMLEFRLKAYRNWLKMEEPKRWPNYVSKRRMHRTGALDLTRRR